VKVVAVLDLGSSSFRLVVAKAGLDGSIQPMLRKRAPLHLGRVVGSCGMIPAAEAELAVETVVRFRRLAEQAGAKKIITVATSALRDADNRDEIAERLEVAGGQPVRFLTGDEEAALTFTAMRAAHSIGKKRVLGLDLGGGSLEIAVGNDRKLDWTGSFELGSSRLSGGFIRHDPPRPEERAALVAHVVETLREVEPELALLRPVQCIAAGGTVKALARVAAAERLGGPPVTVGGTILKVGKLNRLADRLFAWDHEERLAMTGMNPDRADVLGSGAEVLASALALFGFPNLVASDWGLREGIILQALGLGEVRDADARPLRLVTGQATGARRARQGSKRAAVAGER
jgi:exopolyphosphatase/guanosine-5'-triphosphate,3'-diphosphate pyrophosphatase